MIVLGKGSPKYRNLRVFMYKLVVVLFWKEAMGTDWLGLNGD
jgi:hypothetical protein